jgi:hypothetical protein
MNTCNFCGCEVKGTVDGRCDICRAAGIGQERSIREGERLGILVTIRCTRLILDALASIERRL